MSFTNWHLDGKETQGFYLKINLLKNDASTKNKSTNSLAMNKTKSSSNWIWWGSFLLQGIIPPKKDAMLDGVELDLFFVDLLFPNPTTFSCSIHLVQIFGWLVSKCFWNAKIPLVDLWLLMPPFLNPTCATTRR